MAQLTAAPDSQPQNARIRDVFKPQAGQTVLVPVTPQEVLNFKFPISQVRIVLKDIDVYLIFEDGSQLVLPGLGIELSLDPAAPRLVFDTELVLTQDFFARIGPVQTDDEYKAQVLQSVTGTGSVIEEVPNDNISRVPPQPQGQLQAESSSQSPIVLPPPVVTAGTGVPPLPVNVSPSSRSSTASADFTTNNVKPEDGQVIKDVDIAIYTASQTSSGVSDGVNVIKHGFGNPSGAPPAEGKVGNGANFDDFTATDHLDGSSGSDRLYPEDYPSLEVRGYTAAIARVAIAVNVSDGTTGVLRFTVPTSYQIVPQAGIRKIDARTYEADAKVVDGKIVTDVQIAYKVPTGQVAPDSNGFYDRGSIAIRFIEDTTDGTSKEFSTQFLIGIRDVNNQSDLSFTTAGTSQPVYVLPSAPGQNSIAGGDGNDTIYGGGGKDTIDGGSGTDAVSYEWSGAAVSVALGETGSAAVVGSTGFARGDIIINVENLVGSDFADTLTGNSGNNSLLGGLGNDSLTGGGGADTLAGEAGTNVLAGGTGNDVYLVTSAADVIREAAGEGDDTVLVSGISSYTLSDNVERMTFTGTGRFTGTGSSTNNIITGGSAENSLAGMAGADTLIGGAAADTLDGGTGADSMAGGGGNDVYIVDDIADVIDETSPGSGGFDTVIIRASGMNAGGPVTYSLPAGVEMLVYEGSEDATLSGGVDGNTIVGGSGHNLLRGLGGSDSLVGGDQADTLEGGTGPGADSLAGGAGDDVYIVDDAATVILGEDGQSSVDTIRTTLSAYALGTSANVAVENLVFTGTGPFTGTGSDAANLIVGGTQANSLSGGAGDDTLVGSDAGGTLDGGTGNDSLVGGLGADAYVVDSLADVVADTGGIDTIYVAPNSLSGYTLGGTNAANIENLTNLGSAAFTGLGSDVDNVLTAGTGDNSMFGAGGNDMVIGLDGNDTLDGGIGNDTIVGGRGANLLIGGDGNDSLVGGADSETILGGDGADTIVSGGAGALAGSESLAGGTGDDVYVIEGVSQNSHAVVIGDTGGTDVILTNATAWDLRQDNANTVENLTFTGAGAVGFGNVLANVVTGGTGNDTLTAITNTNGIGGDTLYGGDGNDSLVAAAGSAGDVLGGDAGADILVGSDGASTLLGGADDDLLLGGTGNESLDGGLGNDTISGGDGNDVVVDTLGANSIDAGLGNDSVLTGTGADTILGGAGADTIDGGGGLDSIAGGLGNDLITVRSGATVDGGANDDTFILTTGNASIAGGSGTDEIVITGPIDGTVRSFSLAGQTTGIEKLTVTGSTAFTLAGDGNANTITGGSGNDSLGGAGNQGLLVGGLGDDTLSGVGGAATLQGGAGNDVYVIDSASDVAIENAGGGIDEIRTTLSTFTLTRPDLVPTNIEVIKYSGNVADPAFTGFNVQGDAGDQTIFGTSKSDLIDGGLGSGDAAVIDYTIQNLNQLGPKIGTYVVDGVARDLYAFTPVFTDGNSLQLFQSKTTVGFSSAGTGNDTLSGVEYVIVNNAVLQVQLGVTNYGDQGPGTPFSTTALGTIVTDDTMNGTALPDNLFGGRGNDTYLINNAADTISEGRTVSGAVTDAGGIDTVLLTGASFTNAGGVAVFDMGIGNTANFVPLNLGTRTTTGIENLTLIGTVAASIAGNELDNVITTGVGNDTISGGAGNDTLNGGAGADSMAGGSGDDVYIIDSVLDAVFENTGIGTNGSDSLWVSGNGTYDVSSTQFANVENIYARNAAGAVVGGAYTMLGSIVNNILAGGLGTDSMSGGAGADTLISLGGADTLDGGSGNDVYVIDWRQQTGSVSFIEAAGTATGGVDEIRTTGSFFDLSDTRNGAGILNIENLRSVGGDYVTLGTAAFTGLGNDLGNTITGSDGVDSLVGGAGNDMLIGGAGADTLDGATRGDTVPGSLSDTLMGGAGNDWYLVNSTADTVLGEAAGTGAGFIDTIEVSSGGLLNLSTGTVTPLAYTLTASNVENLIYSGSANATLAGNSLDNLITGGSGNDSIFGDNTTSTGTSSQADTLAGGLGDDTYFVDSANDVVVERAGEGTDTIRTSLTAYSLATVAAGGGTVENLSYAGDPTLGASLVGSASGNSIVGGASSDTLDGGLNADGTGDTLAGGSGNDYYILQNDGDTISETSNVSGGTFDTVELRFNPGSAVTLGVSNTLASGKVLNLTGIENLVYAGPGAITVTGSSGANSIVGGSGADCINGGAGADSMAGGGGNDAYFVDVASPAGASPAGDVVIELAGGGADTVYTNATLLDLGSGWYSNVEALAYVNSTSATSPGTSAFTGLGNTLDNTIVGGTSNNSIFGGTGNDSLFGGVTADTLDGGTGADTMAGISGNDVYIVDDVRDVVLEAGGLGSTANGTDEIRVYGSSTFNSFSLADSRWAGVENLTFSGAGGVATTTGFVGSGNGFANLITGSSGGDTLSAGFGGTDTLSGGAGNDLLQMVASTTNMFQVYSGGGAATGFSTALGAGAGGGISLGFNLLATSAAAGATENLQVGNVTVSWVGGTVTFSVFGGQAWAWNVARDGALHSIAVSFDGTSPVVYLDGQSLGVGASATNTSTGGTAGTLNLIANTFNFDLVDNIRVYDKALSGTELATVTAGGGTATGVAQDNLVGFYTFESGASNTAGTINPNAAAAFGGSLSGSAGSIINIGSVSLDGGTGNDTLVSSGAGDTLDGGAGADSMVGGAGSDTYFVDSLLDRVVDTSGALDRLLVSSGVTTFSLQTSGVVANNTIEVVQVDTRPGQSTASDNFVLTGNSTLGTNIWGGYGADSLYGGSGADVLTGFPVPGFLITDTKEDYLDGRGGNDSYYIALYGNGAVGTGSDQVLDSGSTADADSVYIWANTSSSLIIDLGVNFSGTIENVDVRNSTVSNTLIGTSVVNVLVGGSGADSLWGGAGNDVLYGQWNNGAAGADTMDGGSGDDSYYVYNVNSLILDAAGGGNDRIFVNSAIGAYTLPGSSSTQEIEGLARQGTTGAASFYGNTLDNNITGSSSADYLWGGAGNDAIAGNEGADTLIGGIGNDTLAVRISDYVSGLFTDSIDGGTGTDTFVVQNSVFTNATAGITGLQLDTMLDNIEIIDLKTAYIGVNITNLTAANIQGITGATGAAAVLTIRTDVSTIGSTVIDTVSASAASASGVNVNNINQSSVTAAGTTTTTTDYWADAARTQLVAKLIVQAS